MPQVPEFRGLVLPVCLNILSYFLLVSEAVYNLYLALDILVKKSVVYDCLLFWFSLILIGKPKEKEKILFCS